MFLSPPTITTSRLILRKLEMEDAPLFFTRLGKSEAVTRYMLWQPHKELSESEQSIRKVLARYQEGTSCRWAIALKESNELIGIIDLLRFDEIQRSCSFAYMLGQDFWGQGYGIEAVCAAFRYAFETLHMDRIVADHFVENPSSGAVMRKAGMEFIGMLPEQYEKEGIKHDAAQYQITAEQWIKRSRS